MAEPLHLRIFNELRASIETGEFSVGEHLPSESALQGRYSVSRGPIRQALNALREEGLIEVRQGRSPVVREPSLAHSIDSFFSFTQWVRSTGHRPGQKTVETSRRVPQEAARAALHLETDDMAVDVVRLRLIDDRPVMLERTTFALEAGQHLLAADLDSGSIFELLIRCGVPLDQGVHTIDAVAAEARDADLLEVNPGTPLIRVIRVTSSHNGVPLEYSEDLYRSDRAQLIVRNQRASRSAIVRNLPTREN